MEKRKWTIEEKRTLLELYKKGYSYSEIARILGRGTDSVKSALKRLGILRGNLARERLRKPGLLALSPEEIVKLIQSECDSFGDKVYENGKAFKSSSREYLSDEEAIEIVRRYLKETANFDGAINLWKVHLSYKRKKLLFEESLFEGG